MTRTHWAATSVGVAVLFTLIASPSYGQATGRITGTVVDETGAVIPGATVVARNVSTGLGLESITTTEGIFRYPELPIRPYEITVRLTGFSTLRSGVFSV